MLSLQYLQSKAQLLAWVRVLTHSRMPIRTALDPENIWSQKSVTPVFAASSLQLWMRIEH